MTAKAYKSINGYSPRPSGLALFGVVMVYSASAVIAQQENHSQFHYVIKQAHLDVDRIWS